MKAGFWNVNGFNIDKQSDNFLTRDTIVNHLDLDIIGIAETHLIDNNVINCKNYKWFGHNRTNIHVNAWAGSGGVGFLIKYNLLEYNYLGVLAC